MRNRLNQIFDDRIFRIGFLGITFCLCVLLGRACVSTYLGRFKVISMTLESYDFALKPAFLPTANIEYAYEDANDIRVVSINFADTSRLFVIDFAGSSKINYETLSVAQEEINGNKYWAYHFIEMPEGPSISVNNSIKNIGFQQVNLEKGIVFDHDTGKNFVIFEAKFKTLGLGKRNTDFLFDLEDIDAKCNLFIGSYEKRLLVCLFFNSNGQSIGIQKFKEFFLLPE